MEIKEEIIPFTVEIKGNFYYRHESGEYDRCKAKPEIYVVFSKAIEAFENYDGDIEIEETRYDIDV